MVPCNPDPSRPASNNASRPRIHRLCKAAFGLQKKCQVVDRDEGGWMRGSQLILASFQRPAIKLLRLAQGGLWMDGSRVAPRHWREAISWMVAP